jgi:hypothetical protein
MGRRTRESEERFSVNPNTNIASCPASEPTQDTQRCALLKSQATSLDEERRRDDLPDAMVCLMGIETTLTCMAAAFWLQGCQKFGHSH